ncbi:MAG: hypothetical protein ACOC1K_03595 [Nanoarchaeota archaeon]
MKIILNKNESKILIDLLEVALKQGGFKTAETAIYFKNKIENSMNEDTKEDNKE